VGVNVLANVVVAALGYLAVVFFGLVKPIAGLVLLAVVIAVGAVLVLALAAFGYLWIRFFRKPGFWLLALLGWMFWNHAATAEERKIKKVFEDGYLAAMDSSEIYGRRAERYPAWQPPRQPRRSGKVNADQR
jgi:hypothetical protein